MSRQADFLEAFEYHSPARIRSALAAGSSPVAWIDGKRPIDILIEMYTRSAKFSECLRVLLDAGATIGDPLLEALLLDDDAGLRRMLAASDEPLRRKFSIVSAYTSCKGVWPLHICAEHNSLACAQVLIQAGADINAAADTDSHGIGGQTPLFHCVNSNSNYCRPVMELLVDAGADLDIRLKGLVWGETMDWETIVYDITPISYAQCGLYKQFHRREADTYSNLAYLHRKKYGEELQLRNVPNKYLTGA